MARWLKPGEFSKPDLIDRHKRLTAEERRTTKAARWQYRVEYRDATGRRREVSGSGTTKGAAERRLRRNLDRVKGHETPTLNRSTTVAVLAGQWLAERRATGDARPNTLSVYSSEVEQTIVPAFGALRLGEVTTGLLHNGLRTIEERKATKQTRTVLRQIFDYAMRLQVLDSNPMVGIPAATRRPRKAVRALSPDEVVEVFAALRRAQEPNPRGGPRPDGRLIDLVVVMLATGARIGEVLALRWCDVHLDAEAPYVEFTGTVIEPRKDGAKTLHRQPYTKGDRSDTDDDAVGRSVALPDTAVEALSARYKRVKYRRLEDPVFANRSGGWLWPRNVYNSLNRAMTEHSTIEGVHPHLFRATLATWVTRSAGVSIAQMLLGHSSPETTKAYVAKRREVVDARAILDAVWKGTG